MGQSKNQGQSQQRPRFMLTSPHDAITDPKSAAKMPFVPILLPDTQATQAQGHGGHIPSSPSNFKVGPGRSNNVNGPRPRAPYTPTRPARPPPTAGPGHYPTQHPHQSQGHLHQYKLMEVVPVPATATGQHGQPSPGDPGFVFRPATEPPVPPVPKSPASKAPAPAFQVPQSPSYTFQAPPLVLHNGSEGSFFEGVGTLWILNVEQLDETGQSNLTQENSQIASSEERSEEKPPAWDKLNCIFCRSNGEPPSVYKNHHLRDDQNKTVCPILMKYTCPVCKKTGEEAHTLKYCPQKPKNVDMVTSASPNVRTGNKIQPVKKVLSSTGRSYRLKY